MFGLVLTPAEHDTAEGPFPKCYFNITSNYITTQAYIENIWTDFHSRGHSSWSLACFPFVVISTHQKHIADLAAMENAAQAFSHSGHNFWLILDTTICDHIFFRGTFEEYGPDKWGGGLTSGREPHFSNHNTSYDCLRLHWRHQTISTTFRGTINLPRDEDKWRSIYGRPSCSFTSVCELRALSLIFLLCRYAL